MRLHVAKGPVCMETIRPGQDRVTLPVESTSASVIMSKKLSPLPEPATLAHALNRELKNHDEVHDDDVC